MLPLITTVFKAPPSFLVYLALKSAAVKDTLFGNDGRVTDLEIVPEKVGALYVALTRLMLYKAVF